MADLTDPNDPFVTAVTELARAAAARATDVTLRHFAARDELDFGEKSNGKQAHSDLVSAADLDSQRAVRDTVLTARPHDAFLGEEHLDDDPSTVASPDEVAPGRLLWVVDPVDATLNFAYGRGEWAVSVSASLDGTPVASVVVLPVRRETFVASGDQAWLEAPVGGRELSMAAPVALDRALVEIGRGKPSKLPWLTAALDGRVRDLRRGGCAAAAICDVAAGRVDVCIQADLGVWDWAGAAHVVTAAGGTVTTSGPLLVAAHRELVDPVLALLDAHGGMPA
jgi:myo-inositol-1(or 4)-monophosphatase